MKYNINGTACQPPKVAKKIFLIPSNEFYDSFEFDEAYLEGWEEEKRAKAKLFEKKDIAWYKHKSKELEDLRYDMFMATTRACFISKDDFINLNYVSLTNGIVLRRGVAPSSITDSNHIWADNIIAGNAGTLNVNN